MPQQNSIPFSNMSRDEADKVPFSPYAKFCQSLVGILVFHKETKKYWTKSELFSSYSNKPKELKKISQHQHPDFKFINQNEW